MSSLQTNGSSSHRSHRDPESPVQLRRSPRTSGPRFFYAETIVHTAVSAENTPRDSFQPSPDFLAAESGSASFSFGAVNKQAGGLDADRPEITGLDLSGGQSNYVLMGDSNGRVALYGPPPSHSRGDPIRQRVPRFWHQAFTRELDVLRSVEIEERVTRAMLMPRRSPTVVSYLVANCRSIKMYRMREDAQRTKSKNVAAVCTFSGPHLQAPIHSVSLCSDEQTFLSCDDFQVQWWDLEAGGSSKPLCLVDIRPGEDEEVRELLTSAAFHPTHGSLFLVSSSDGWAKIGDLRDPPSRSSRRYATTMTTLPEHNKVRHTTHDDVLCSVADAAFLRSNYVVTRDYISVKVWDTRNPTAPVRSLPVHECLQPHIDELYDNDALFDRFGLSVDQHSGTIVTGMYNGQVAVWQPESELEPVFIKASSYDDTASPGPLQWSDNESFFTRRVTNVGISDVGSTVAFSSHDRLFVFDRDNKGQAKP